MRPFHATNDPGTCLWCGHKLRKQRFGDGRGDYGDGVFCGLRCGYQFGLAFANLGKRLQPKAAPPTPPDQMITILPVCEECGGKMRDTDAFDGLFMACPRCSGHWIECDVVETKRTGPRGNTITTRRYVPKGGAGGP